MEYRITSVPNFNRDFTFSAKFMKDIGNNVKKRTQNRTASGRDVNNKKFKNYSEGYAKSKGVGRSNVNLRVTGKMLNNIIVLASKNKVDIRAKDSKAKYHQYMGAGKGKVKRVWFGVGRDFQRILTVLFNREFRRLANKRIK